MSSRSAPTAASSEIADEKGRWIDALAMRGRAFAWSAGKQVRARDETGAVRTWSAPSTVRGLAFQPKGFRLAATHYNGATLWFPEGRRRAADAGMEGRASRRDLLSRRPLSRHLDAGERAARLAARGFAQHAHDRISGQDALALLVARRGWLATSGADAAVVWPFKDKDGPMGKAPRECGVRDARVTRVAFHPKALVVAIGYADGLVLLCRLADAAEILVRDRRTAGRQRARLGREGARLLVGLDSGRRRESRRGQGLREPAGLTSRLRPSPAPAPP